MKTQQIIPVENKAKVSKLSTTWRTIVGIAITVLVFCVIFGGYHSSKFIILLTSDYFNSDWINTKNVMAWILSALAILAVFGILRFITSYISRLFSFVFKFAQSDIVTIVLASGVNVLFLTFGGWLTYQMISLMDKAPIQSFFQFSNPFSVFVLFYMFAGALIWVPRLGLYGENQIGAALDDGDRW